MSDGSAMRYLEDFAVGDRFPTESMTVEEGAVVSFAEQFDPQDFHLDRAAAAGSPFGELVASGWHTAAITMRIMVDSRFLGASPMIGLGVEAMKWPQPVRPGDTLSATVEVLEIRPSASNPARGTIRILTTTVNEAGETVYEMTSTVLVSRRPAG